MAYKMDKQKRYYPTAPLSAAKQALATMRAVPFPPQETSAEPEGVRLEGADRDPLETLLETITTDKTEPVDGKFRLAAERFFLTYRTHLDKAKVEAFFKGLKTTAKLDEVFTAHEVASSETNYEHSHVFVSFKKAFTSSKARIFDMETEEGWIHPNIKIVSSKAHMEHIWAYLCKEDHSNDHLLSRVTKETIFDKICAQKTLRDALRLAKSPTEAGGIRDMFAMREMTGIVFQEPKHTWQKQLADELVNGPISDRRIIWIKGAHGGEGKTSFSKYMKHANGAFTLNSLKGMGNVAMNVGTAKDNGWDCRCAILNFARDFKEEADLYPCMECFKDGEMSKTKYAGGDLTFPTPHLICMANVWPTVTALSFDRWDLREIIQEGQHEDGSDDYIFTSKSYTEILKDIKRSKPFQAIEGDFNKIIKDIARSKPDATHEEIIDLVAHRLRSSYIEWNPTTTLLNGR